MSVKIFRLQGSYRRLKRNYKFSREIRALTEENACEQLYTLLGSFHSIKRWAIKIEKLDKDIAALAFSKEKSTEVICASCSMRDSIRRIAEYAADIAEITINRSYEPSF